MIKPVDKLTVLYEGKTVGTLARTPDGLFPFEYSNTWLMQGFPLNPLTLPLQKGVFLPKPTPLEGMFGVFNDSLPDGWGHLLVDRMLRAHAEDPYSVDALTRLAIVGHSGMGALCYEPAYDIIAANPPNKNLDLLAQEASHLLAQKPIDNLDTLFILGGSSGGARPKILTNINGQDWIIKFPSSYDPPSIGQQEYQYALCAQQCGINMPEVRLFASQLCAGYFGVKRFDRSNKGQKTHMVSVSGLLETSHRTPNLDYKTLMKLTLTLTQSPSEAQQLYRLMCFNVFAHNRDDHSKNFSFLYNDKSRQWQLAPAYDLTYSSSFNGEHATTVAGNGKDPGIKDLLAVADFAGLSLRWAKQTAEDIEATVLSCPTVMDARFQGA